MANYTREDVEQFLEGGARITKERERITRFCQMLTANIGEVLHELGMKTPRTNPITFKILSEGKENVFRIEWELKPIAAGYNVRALWGNIDITAGATSKLRIREVTALYDRLSSILGVVIDYFPSIALNIEFFINAAKRR